jgi:hypothetical protein
LAQAEKDLKDQESPEEMDTRTLVFMTITSDVLMTLENVSKKERWCSVLKKIETEEWYQMCVKWSFLFEQNHLGPDAVLESEKAVINITSIKILVPQITFEFPKGKFLVSIPFDYCRSSHTNRPSLTYAWNEAKIKLLELDKNRRDITEILPYPDGHVLGNHYFLFFRDKNGESFENGILPVPEDNNLIIVGDYVPL